MRRLLPALAVAALLFGLAWLLARPTELSPEPAPAASAGLAPTASGGPSPTKPKVHLPRPSTPPTKRVRQSSGAAADAPAPAAPAPVDRAASTESPGDGGPVDRRENAPDDGGKLRAAIMERMDLVRDDVADCINDWVAAGERVDGKVMIGFHIDAGGLQDAWLDEVSEIPDGPKSCFAAAVYEVDWADVATDPLEITMPFTVTTDDVAK